MNLGPSFFSWMRNRELVVILGKSYKQKSDDDLKHIVNYMNDAITNKELLDPHKIKMYLDLYDKYRSKHMIHTLPGDFRALKNSLINYLLSTLQLPARRTTSNDCHPLSYFNRSVIVNVDKEVYISFHVKSKDFKYLKDLDNAFIPYIFNKHILFDLFMKIKLAGITTVADYLKSDLKPEDKFTELAMARHEKLQKEIGNMQGGMNNEYSY